MAISPSTSVERRAGPEFGIYLVLFWTLLFLTAVSPSRAGSIITLVRGAETDGKLAVAGPAIHVEAASAEPDTALADVLESRFDDAPFTLDSYHAGANTPLPPQWTAQDIGDVINRGAVTVQSGTFLLTGSSNEKNKIPYEDCLYFVGMPWPANAQFTARVTSLDPQTRGIAGGLSLRDSLEPNADLFSAFVDGAGGLGTLVRSGKIRGNVGAQSTANLPLWLRVGRLGPTVVASFSPDGTNWDEFSESSLGPLANPFLGLIARSLSPKVVGTAAFDHVSITPLPSSARVLPPGLLLQGGSLVAGKFSSITLDPATPDSKGAFMRASGKLLPVTSSLIAGVITLPINRPQLAQMASKPEVLMENGDTTDGNVTSISTGQITVGSILLGITSYRDLDVRAATLAPLQVKASAYEVRLRDGSIIRASAITGSGDNVTITDISGLSIPVSQDEIAQIRAGTVTAQNLAELDWKATAPASTPSPASAPANPGAAANPAPEPTPPLVEAWLGNDQEQILETGIGTQIDFPLPGKFRALGVQVALASGSPPNATTSIRILADGHEIARSPVFHAGDQPRFLELTFSNPAHITLEAESLFNGTKVLYIDPVVIR